MDSLYTVNNSIKKETSLPLFNDFNSYIFTLINKNFTEKLILDEEFLSLCFQLYDDLRTSFISAVWGIDGATNTNYLNEEQKVIWTSSLYTHHIWNALCNIINLKNIKHIYCLFEYEDVCVEDDIEEECIPIYLLCGMLLELKNVKVISNSSILPIFESYSLYKKQVK